MAVAIALEIQPLAAASVSIVSVDETRQWSLWLGW